MAVVMHTTVSLSQANGILLKEISQDRIILTEEQWATKYS
jgi:hypothetical protein